jgi:FxsC-like protein
VPLGPVSTESAPYFFLGYAHTPEKPWVEKLYRDICAEVMERTTLPVTVDVGFMDGSAIPLGGDWRDEVARALATCRVFVPLYSPRYFTRAECGVEWHAFAQRILDHRARNPGDPAAIVPALWTPVEAEDMPDAARRIQINHADLGFEYAKEGFYTLIKNTLYRQEYMTAVQRLARHIIRAAEASRLQPCQIRDLGPPRNAFDMPGRRAPADRQLNLIVAAPTVDRLPGGRSSDFYGDDSNDWNPFHPWSRQAIAEYAAGVARLNSYEPNVLSFDEGCEFFADSDPSAGLGLLLVDAWATTDDDLARRLAHLDALDVGWVGTMVPWNMQDVETRSRSDELRERLRALLPNRLGDTRPFTAVNSTRIGTLEEFRTKLPDVLEGALLCYLNHAVAHPPPGTIPPRPRLSTAVGSEPEAGAE